MSPFVGDEHLFQLIKDFGLELFDFIVDFVSLIGQRCQKQGENRILLNAFQVFAVGALFPNGNGFFDDFFCPLACIEYRLFHFCLI